MPGWKAAVALAGSIVFLCSLAGLPLGVGHSGASLAPGRSVVSPGALAPRTFAAPVKAVSLHPPSPNKRWGASTKATEPSVRALTSYPPEPAPMGIADVGRGNFSSATTAYAYNTSEVRGVVTLGDDPVVENSSLGLTSAMFSTQLNVMLKFATPGGARYVYWVQDVAYYDTANDQLILIVDNIWNDSAPNSQMYSSSVSGSGSVQANPHGAFYVTEVAPSPGDENVSVTQGMSYALQMDTGIVGGVPFVKFIYNDSSAGPYAYDTATFPFATGVASSSFFVNGFSLNPIQLPYDLEFIIGGPGNGSQQHDVQSDFYLQLYYFNGANFQAPRSAFNFGGETAEGIDNVSDTVSYSSPLGGLSAVLVKGNPQNSVLGQLYSPADVGTLNFTDPSANGGTLFVNGAPTPFSGTEANLTLGPGSYTMSVQVGGTTTALGKCTLAAGSLVRINLTFTCASVPAPTPPTPSPTPTTSSLTTEIAVTVAALVAGLLVTVLVLGGFRRRAAPTPSTTGGPGVAPPGWGPPPPGYPAVSAGYSPGYGPPVPATGPLPATQGPATGPPASAPFYPPQSPAYGAPSPAASPGSGPSTMPPRNRICSQCGNFAGPKAVWCPRCGAPLPPG